MRRTWIHEVAKMLVVGELWYVESRDDWIPHADERCSLVDEEKLSGESLMYQGF